MNLNLVFRRILILTDNVSVYRRFKETFNLFDFIGVKIEYFCSYNNNVFNDMVDDSEKIDMINVKNQYKQILQKYDLVISAHCKQLFPKEMVRGVKCINIHPGYNPYNRGWYPQVFSIINKMPAGATIHEIDENLDHGKIIDQMLVDVYSWDTSESLYDRVLDAEFCLIERSIVKILENNYKATNSFQEGNLNLKKDFNDICLIDLKRSGTFGEVVDLLRALTHGEYKNAYFVDTDGKKVYIRLSLEKE